MEAEQIATKVMMTKQEAQEKDAQIIKLSGDYIDVVGPTALEMREREGWRALGFKTWTDYCKHVDKRISAVNVMRLAQKAEVEQNVQARLAMRHALQLVRISDPEGQREVYAEVTKAFEKPQELNYETYVETWLNAHKQSTRVKGQRGGHWVDSDLEDDPELAKAFDKIQEVYGAGDRKAFQEGTIGWTRKDIVGLANFQVSKMKEVHYLIMETHWDLARCFKFANQQLDRRDRIEKLLSRCLLTSELCYACSVDGYDIQINACPALSSKIKALRSKPKGQTFRVSVRELSVRELGSIF
jgi:hypothetical protein